MKRCITSIFVTLSIIMLAGCDSGRATNLTTPTFMSTLENTPSPIWVSSAAAKPTQSISPVSTDTQNTQTSPTSTMRSSYLESIPTATPTVFRNSTPTFTTTPTHKPDSWKNQPIIPAISDTVVRIYLDGLELGNNPNAFSKIGDCGSTPTWFLGDFDRGTRYYRLGKYQNLSGVIQEFKGSFDRTSLAARSGFNASALFTPLWADLAYCQSNETPLACEYRIHRPVIAFIMLGANDVWHPEEFEPQMRKIIEFSIDNGVIPILATKADNQEKDHSINATITRLALEYDIPLWNYWRATDQLPDRGLQEDNVHLTWGPNFFDDPNAMTKAWPIRNLTALQTLNAIWRKVTNQDQ